VDKAGRIWLLHEHAVRVLIGDKWVQAALPGQRRGGPKAIRFLAAPGDRSRVYLASLRLDLNGGVAYLGHVSSGKVVLERAPDCGIHFPPAWPVRMPDNSIWLNRVSMQSPAVPAEANRRMAQRFDGMRTVDELRDVGWPKLLDRSGLLWTSTDWGGKAGSMCVVRPGRDGKPAETIGRVHVPYADIYAMMCLSDRPGSVFIWSHAGLHHFVASPAAGGDYRLRATYHLQGDGKTLCRFAWSWRSLDYTPLGYFLVLDFDNSRGSLDWRLHLIPVPAEPILDRPRPHPRGMRRLP
jgi:hypothetical protein